MMQNTPPKLSLFVDGLTQSRGGRVLFRGLSFAVGGGEALILTGPNGTGKTTLLRTIAGLLPPEQGSVRLEGGDREISAGEQAHLVGHANAIKAQLTVGENDRHAGQRILDSCIPPANRRKRLERVL